MAILSFVYSSQSNSSSGGHPRRLQWSSGPSSNGSSNGDVLRAPPPSPLQPVVAAPGSSSSPDAYVDELDECVVSEDVAPRGKSSDLDGDVFMADGGDQQNQKIVVRQDSRRGRQRSSLPAPAERGLLAQQSSFGGSRQESKKPLREFKKSSEGVPGGQRGQQGRSSVGSSADYMKNSSMGSVAGFRGGHK